MSGTRKALRRAAAAGLIVLSAGPFVLVAPTVLEAHDALERREQASAPTTAPPVPSTRRSTP